MVPALSGTVFQEEGDECATLGQVVDRTREEFKALLSNTGVAPIILQGFRKGTPAED